MSERNLATPYGAACSYFEGLHPDEQLITGHYGGQLQENGNKAFAQGDFDALVVVPLLITEEGGATETLDLIRQQNTQSGVAISANLPLGGTRMATAQRNISDIMEYGFYNDLPLSFYLAGYSPETPIGRIVRDLYGASLHHLANTHGASLRNIPLVRCDGDPVALSPRYLPAIHEYWRQDTEPNKCVYPIVQHSRLAPSEFPHINRLLDWYDLKLRLTRSIVSAHFAVDIVGYAASSGLTPTCAISEVSDILGKMEASATLPPLRLHQVDEEVIVSCRRIAKRSATEGYPVYDALYMSSDDHPTHRTEPPAGDISEQDYRRQAGWLVHNTVQLYGDRKYRMAQHAGMTAKQAGALAVESMHIFGETALQEFGDPPSMQRVVEAAIKTWPKSGPPAGKPRQPAMIKPRKITADKTAGGAGVVETNV